MNTPEVPHQQPSHRAHIPYWMAFVAAPIVWGGAPWAISLLTPRYGWAAGLYWLLGTSVRRIAHFAFSSWLFALHVKLERETS